MSIFEIQNSTGRRKTGRCKWRVDVYLHPAGSAVTRDVAFELTAS